MFACKNAVRIRRSWRKACVKMVPCIRFLRELASYQISLLTILLNLFIITIVSTYQFVSDALNVTCRLLFRNPVARRLNLVRNRLSAAIRRKCKQCWYRTVGCLTKDDDLDVCIDDSCETTNQSIFFSNKENDHKILQVLEKMDIVLNWVRFWPASVREVIKHVEKRLYLEAEYASRILSHCQQTRSSLSKDELSGNFFDFRPIFMSTINQEFEITNEVIQNCEALLTTDFVQPLEEKIKDFNERLSTVKRNWNAKVNQMQNLVIELRKNQKLYLKCALHYVRLIQSESESFDETAYSRREENYRRLLVKAEAELKLRINSVNGCLVKLERFKGQCLNEIQYLVSDASSEVRRLTLNYITKLYPNQKPQLLNQMISIVPEVEFRNFLDNLKIPRLPRYHFTNYDEIKC